MQFHQTFYGILIKPNQEEQQKSMQGLKEQETRKFQNTLHEQGKDRNSPNEQGKDRNSPNEQGKDRNSPNEQGKDLSKPPKDQPKNNIINFGRFAQYLRENDPD